MEKLQVITKFDTHIDWVNSMVVVEKPSRALQICFDTIKQGPSSTPLSSQNA